MESVTWSSCNTYGTYTGCTMSRTTTISAGTFITPTTYEQCVAAHWDLTAANSWGSRGSDTNQVAKCSWDQETSAISWTAGGTGNCQSAGGCICYRGSFNNLLSSMSWSSATISPSFSASTISYNVAISSYPAVMTINTNTGGVECSGGISGRPDGTPGNWNFANNIEPGWVYAGAQGNTISLGGTQQVRYGNNAGAVAAKFVIQTHTSSSVSCTNSVFQNPAPGDAKTCKTWNGEHFWHFLHLLQSLHWRHDHI